MGAFLWNANPALWEVVPPTSSGWDALQLYISAASRFVYWSTPKLQREIAVGDVAYIWRTTFKNTKNGVIAKGRVEEAPRQLSNATKNLFLFPERLAAAGWNETTAPSVWKTGIRIEKTFWENPIHPGLKPPQGSVGRLSDDDLTMIDGLILPMKK